MTVGYGYHANDRRKSTQPAEGSKWSLCISPTTKSKCHYTVVNVIDNFTLIYFVPTCSNVPTNQGTHQPTNVRFIPTGATNIPTVMGGSVSMLTAPCPRLGLPTLPSRMVAACARRQGNRRKPSNAIGYPVVDKQITWISGSKLLGKTTATERSQCVVKIDYPMVTRGLRTIFPPVHQTTTAINSNIITIKISMIIVSNVSSPAQPANPKTIHMFFWMTEFAYTIVVCCLRYVSYYNYLLPTYTPYIYGIFTNIYESNDPNEDKYANRTEYLGIIAVS